jgi:hypothetical protein
MGLARPYTVGRIMIKLMLLMSTFPLKQYAIVLEILDDRRLGLTFPTMRNQVRDIKRFNLQACRDVRRKFTSSLLSVRVT